MTELDKDNPLKERTARILFSQGHLCRFNVDVVSLGRNDAKNTYTDVDVLGVRFDELLRPELVVVECKTGASASTRDRMFWLQGVKERYHAKRGMFIREQVDPSPYIHDYTDLGLSIMSAETLRAYEEANATAALEGVPPVPTGSVVASAAELGKLKTFNRDYQRYLTALYWNQPVGAQIEALMQILRNLPSGELEFARLTILAQLSVSMADLVGRVMQYPPNKWLDATRLSMSGALDLQAQEKIMASVHAFVSQEIKSQTKQNWGVTKEAFVRALDPKALPDLVDLVQRLQKNPATRYLGQVFDIIAYSEHIANVPVNFSWYPWLKELDEAAKRGVQDMLAFLERAGSLKPADRATIMILLERGPAVQTRLQQPV